MATEADFTALMDAIRAEVARIAAAFQALLAQVASGGINAASEAAFLSAATALVADMAKIGAPAAPVVPPVNEV